MRTRVLTAVLGVSGVLAAAGCGGGSGGKAESQTSATTPPTSAKTITISETDFKLDPSPVTIASAGTYTFEAINNGGTDHALTVEGNGLAETRTDSIAPGQSASITVDLKPGTYRMYCPIAGHQKLGMVGNVLVGG